jgi:hypothetical protein
LVLLGHQHALEVASVTSQGLAIAVVLEVPDADIVLVELSPARRQGLTVVHQSQLSMRTPHSFNTTETADKQRLISANVPQLNELIITTTEKLELSVMLKCSNERIMRLDFLHALKYDPSIVGAQIKHGPNLNRSGDANSLAYKFAAVLLSFLLYVFDIRQTELELLESLLDAEGQILFLLYVEDKSFLVDHLRPMLEPATHLRFLNMLQFVDITLADEDGLLKKFPEVVLETVQLASYLSESLIGLLLERSHSHKTLLSNPVVRNRQLLDNVMVAVLERLSYVEHMLPRLHRTIETQNLRSSIYLTQ